MIDTTWIMSPQPVVPWGLRKALRWVSGRLQASVITSVVEVCERGLVVSQVKEHYQDVPVYVMANGVQEDPARFKDTLRVYYLYNYINEALKGLNRHTAL